MAHREEPKFAKRDECELQHAAIEKEFKEVHGKLDYIVGKVDGMAQQKNSDVSFFAMLGAIALGIWNLLIK